MSDSSMPVLMDTDPGLDDILALALAHATLPVQAWTTVAGNGPLETVTDNALRLRDLLGAEIALVPGAKAPLNNSQVDALEAHGEDVRGGIDLPEARSDASPTDVKTLIAELAGSNRLRIIAIGPLSNLPSALEDSTLRKQICEVVWMGGGLHQGNATPYAEFNAYADPEALAQVLSLNVPLRIIPLDITRQVCLEKHDLSRSRLGESPLAKVLQAIGDAMCKREMPCLHDPCAVAAVLQPELFDWTKMRIRVDTSEGEFRGQLHAEETRDGFVRVATQVDAEAVHHRILDGLTRACHGESEILGKTRNS